MRPFRSLVLLSCLLSTALAVTGCFGGGIKPPTGNGASLVGTVRNEYGHPVHDARLSLGGITATTGPDGAFRLAGAPSGSQTVSFRSKGYLDRDLTVTLTAGQTYQLTEPGKGGPVILKTVHSLAANQAVFQTMRETQPHTSACDTCHSVEAGFGEKYLDANDQGLCTQQGCHVAPDGGEWEHPQAHLDNTIIKPVGGLAEYDQIGCLRCHVSHADTPGGTLTPGLPANVGNTGYEAYCTDCHNATNPANTYKPATHYGSNCTACHEPNGVAGGHKACTRPEAGCHAVSSTLALSPTHKVGTTPCANCHDTANGPTANYLLKGIGDELCFTGCHEPKHQAVADAFVAAPSDDYRHNVPCVACHNVHKMTTAPNDLLTNPLTKVPVAYPRVGDWVPGDDRDFCLTCHGKSLNDANPATKAWALDWKAKGATDVYYDCLTAPWALSLNTRFRVYYDFSGTIKYYSGHWAHFEGDAAGNPIPCQECHGVHTSKQPNLLENPRVFQSGWWPPMFVVGPPDSDGYPMSGMCHDTCHAKL